MTEPSSTDLPRPEAAAEKIPAAPAPATVKPLTAEEQMALFEKDLKENDWGHQPC